MTKKRGGTSGMENFLAAAQQQRRRATARAEPDAPTDSSRFAGVPIACDAVAQVSPQSVAVSYTFATPPTGEPYALNLRFNATLKEPADLPGEAGRERVELERVVPDLISGIGDATVTVRLPDVRPGRWRVTVTDRGSSERWSTEADSGFSKVMAEIGPGIHPGAWPALVLVGAIAGVSLLGWLSARSGWSVGAVLALAVLACVIGLVSARVYYLVQATTRASVWSTAGLCIQGFLLGAVLTMLAGSWLLGLPPLILLDALTPALLTGMAIGRLGCVPAGCCAGRLSSSRWAVRSSDRRLLARRIPVQLMEAAVAGALAGASLGVLVLGSTAPGLLAVWGFASYVWIRQRLLRLRSTPRRTTSGTRVAGALSAVIAVAALVGLFLGPSPSSPG